MMKKIMFLLIFVLFFVQVISAEENVQGQINDYISDEMQGFKDSLPEYVTDFVPNEVFEGDFSSLTNGEINVLKRFGINYLTCGSLKEILYKIDVVLKEDEDDDLDELDLVASSIAERDYYQNTNK